MFAFDSIRLETVDGELLVQGSNSGTSRLESRGTLLNVGDPSLLVSLSLDLPLLLELVNDTLVVPSDLVRDSLEGSVLSAGLQSQDSESGGDDHLLLSVVWGRHTLVEL